MISKIIPFCTQTAPWHFSSMNFFLYIIKNELSIIWHFVWSHQSPWQNKCEKSESDTNFEGLDDWGLRWEMKVRVGDFSYSAEEIDKNKFINVKNLDEWEKSKASFEKANVFSFQFYSHAVGMWIFTWHNLNDAKLANLSYLLPNIRTNGFGKKFSRKLLKLKEILESLPTAWEWSFSTNPILCFFLF